MVLLVLIALAQLAVSLLILAELWSWSSAGALPAASAQQSIQALQRQTLEALLRAEADARGKVIEGRAKP